MPRGKRLCTALRTPLTYNKLTVSNKYHRLCAEDRKVIANMKQAGKKQIEIAHAIGFSQSVISKELSRNHGERGYYIPTDSLRHSLKAYKWWSAPES